MLECVKWLKREIWLEYERKREIAKNENPLRGTLIKKKIKKFSNYLFLYSLLSVFYWIYWSKCGIILAYLCAIDYASQNIYSATR